MFGGEITPDEVWDYVTHLPRDSATWAAIYADPETVIPDEGAEPPEPRLTEFSPEVEALAAMHDLLAALLANVVALGGGKPPRISPYRRPGAARREAAKARRHEQARREWAELLGQMGIEG
jgi:hypothetical protein